MASIPSILPAAVAWTGAVLFGLSLCWFLYSYLVRWGITTGANTEWTAIALNSALFTAFALHHSLFARQAVKERMRQLVTPRLERSAYTWVASLLFAGVCWYWRPVDGILYRMPGSWAVLGYATQAAGVMLTLRSASAIDPLDLAGVRAAQRSTDRPNQEAPQLQTHGLYGFVRHPLYFAWLLMVFGTPVMTGTRVTFAILSTAYLAVAIPFEERGLVATFGDQYIAYRKRVRWRMVPGIY